MKGLSIVFTDESVASTQVQLFGNTQPSSCTVIIAAVIILFFLLRGKNIASIWTVYLRGVSEAIAPNTKKRLIFCCLWTKQSVSALPCRV